MTGYGQEAALPLQASGSNAERWNAALLLFIVISMIGIMGISQEETPEVGSPAYWLFVLPALLLPLTNLGALVRAWWGPARLIALFGLLGAVWHLARGDLKAVQQLFLIVWVLGWLSSDRAVLRIRHVTVMYVALVAAGTYLWMVTDLNQWGIIPGATVYEGLDWRISFFPNIANSAMLSLAMVLILTANKKLARHHSVVLGIALYFVVFSFVRTAIIALALYVFMRWWQMRKPRSVRSRFWTALLLGILVNLLVASSAAIITQLQSIELVSRLFLRSETNLSAEEVFAQLYRPWLWWQHLQLFWGSSAWMGLGSFDFFEIQIEELNVGTTPAGNEALLTRLLATYGLPAFLFMGFFISRLREAARRDDQWAVACFPSIVILMMQWGSVFHPSDANGALLILIAIRGTYAYTRK